MTINRNLQFTKNMKLLLLIWSSRLSLTNANDIIHQLTEQAISPEFQPQPPPNPFALDNHLYLPPETQTQQPLPYFSSSPEPQIKYLPANDIKIPNPYPQPFERYKEFNPDNRHFGPEQRPYFADAVGSTVQTPQKFISNLNIQNNLSRNSPDLLWEKNEQNPKSRSLQIMNEPNYTNRRDYGTKLPIHQNYQSPAINMAPQNFNRRTLNQQIPQHFQHNNMIETMQDQHKTASSISQQFATPPQQFTTPPLHHQGPPTEAVPILRQSSEMDLDGSFQYETLTGDQTHIVQHGHMENVGTENEEQVIEGSYSFVGDDGQTYSVHYVADGNGFRATGDHLPVAPPIPEIIQRSIQYNIHEEAHRPQSQYGYQDGDNSLSQNNQQAPTTRNQFQSRPEAFTRTPQTMSTQNPVAQSSNIYQQLVVKDATTKNFVQPQVNYAASQGAYIPVSNNVQPTARSYTPPPKETAKTYAPSQNIQTQTGIPYKMPAHTQLEATNNSWLDIQRMFMPSSESQNERSYTNVNKNGISRSSTDVGDEVLINFDEMTPDQYAQMYRSQISPRSVEATNKTDENKVIEEQIKPSEKKFSENTVKPNSPSQIITGKSFLPPSQTVTSSYDYVPRNYNNDGKSYQLYNQTPRNQVIQSENSNKPIQYSRIPNRNNMNNYQTQDILQDFRPHSSNYEQPYDDIITADNLAMESFLIPKIVKPPANIEQNQNTFLKSQHANIQPNIVLPMGNDKPKQLSEVLTPPSEVTQNYYHSDIPKYTTNHIIAPQSVNYNMNDKNNNRTYYSMHQNKVTNNELSNFFPKQGSEMIEQTMSFNTKPPSTEPKRGKSQTHESNRNWIMDDPEKSHNPIQQNEMDESSIDLSHILNLVNMKNYFESSRIKPRTNQQLQTPSVHKQTRNIVLQNPNNSREEKKAFDPNALESHLKYFESPDSANTQKHSYAIAYPNRAEKNKQNGERVYKTLQRSPNTDTPKNGNGPSVQNPRMVPFEQAYISPISDENLRFSKSLPALGRAGPSTKAYIPPQVPIFS